MARIPTLRPRIAIAATHAALPQTKVKDPHYNTPEHQRWSRAVIKRAGGACQAPGCGREGCRLYADHIVELQDGGAPFDLSNGQALCGSCHTAKTARARVARQRGEGGSIPRDGRGPARVRRHAQNFSSGAGISGGSGQEPENG